MKISDILSHAQEQNSPFYSFEYFPPKTVQGVANLLDRFHRMARLHPSFVSITWPATGSETAAAVKPIELCEAALAIEGLEPCCHLTCTNMVKEKIDSALNEAKATGVQNILALRGDPPRDAEHWAPVDTTFRHAVDLVRYIRQTHGDHFSIGVAAYPESHPDSTSQGTDLLHLKEKVDAGADFIITQLFYDPHAFIGWMKSIRGAGITVPILAGIMPIQGYATFRRLIHLTRVTVPQEVHDALESIKHDDAAVKDFGVNYAVSMVKILSDAGVNGFHFSTLNLERTVRRILEELGYTSNATGEKCEIPRKNAGSKLVKPKVWRSPADDFGARTPEAWDDFPNGRWGDARSPAFGEIDGYGVSLHVEPAEALRLWGAPEDLTDLGSLFASYCLGMLSALPWSPDPVLPESKSIAHRLAELNRHHLFTVGSQPAVDGVRSDDSVLGWGPRDGGFVYQKAFVEFFVQPEKVEGLMTRLRKDSRVTFFAGNQKGDFASNAPEDSRNAVTWGVFVGKEILQPTIVEKVSFMAWKEESFSIWHEWSLLYPRKSPSRALLEDVRSRWWLVNVVFNDFKDGRADPLFELVLGLQPVRTE